MIRFGKIVGNVRKSAGFLFLLRLRFGGKRDDLHGEDGEGRDESESGESEEGFHSAGDVGGKCHMQILRLQEYYCKYIRAAGGGEGGKSGNFQASIPRLQNPASAGARGRLELFLRKKRCNSPPNVR